uniref:NACHT domain-containing protein n=1 Tax=Stegastes partitus TaxID=144197 RepID=A0A3B5AID0_9TELE
MYCIYIVNHALLSHVFRKMDLQTCLKTSLRSKYQKLKEAEKSLLPLRICYQNNDSTSPTWSSHQFRHVDFSSLAAHFLSVCVPLTDVLSSDRRLFISNRAILTLGVDGIGKTTMVQRFALDWAEDRGHGDIHFLFVLNFWELNLLKHKLSLIELLQTFYPDLKGLNASSLKRDGVWFVFDGLDEFNLTLDFSRPAARDVSEASTVDHLITSLIKGSLLPGAHVWITSRYSAVRRIPRNYFFKETEVLGFSDAQKERHIRTLIDNEDVACKAIDRMKLSSSLTFLCQIPPICTVMANVLNNPLEAKNRFKLKPLTLTQIYTLASSVVEASNSGVLGKLKKLALLRMGEGSVIYEEDLLKTGITVEEASAFSKECPLLLREDSGLHGTTVFRFGHVSAQEFLAASAKLDELQVLGTASLSESCRRLVDEVREDVNGKWDVFLQFIFGLIKERSLLGPNDELFVYTKSMFLQNILFDEVDPLLNSHIYNNKSSHSASQRQKQKHPTIQNIWIPYKLQQSASSPQQWEGTENPHRGKKTSDRTRLREGRPSASTGWVDVG